VREGGEGGREGREKERERETEFYTHVKASHHF